MHAELCPVCKGSGKWWDPRDNKLHTCHGCQGMGWVAVPDDPFWPEEKEPEETEDSPDLPDNALDAEPFHFFTPWGSSDA